MHEASLARDLARTVLRTADQHHLKTVTQVRVGLAPGSHIPPDTLRLMLAAAWVSTRAEDARVTFTQDLDLDESEARLLTVIGAE